MQSFFDIVIFVDGMSSNIKVGEASDTLPLVEGVVQSIKYSTINDLLRFTDSFTSRYSIRKVALTDTLSLTDGLAKSVLFCTVDDFLYLYDVGDNPAIYTLSDSVVLVDLSVSDISKLTTGELTFSDIMSFRIDGDRVNLDTLTPSDYVSAFAIGQGTRTTQILYHSTINITFDSLAGQTLLLPAPKFGDAETVQYKRINRELSGGEQVISGYNSWQSRKLFKCEFDYLDEQQINRFRKFMIDNVGLPVSCTDHNSKLRTLIFQNPQAEFSQIGRENRTFILDCYEI